MDHSVYIWLLWAMFIVVIFLSGFYYPYFLFDIRHFQFNVTSSIFQKQQQMTWISLKQRNILIFIDFRWIISNDIIFFSVLRCQFFHENYKMTSFKVWFNHNPIFLRNKIIFAIDFNSLPHVFFMHHHVVQFTRHKLRFLLQM